MIKQRQVASVDLRHAVTEVSLPVAPLSFRKLEYE